MGQSRVRSAENIRGRQQAERSTKEHLINPFSALSASFLANVIKVDAVTPDTSEIEKAAAVIRDGGLVAFPTETVYGLGADSFNEEACRAIYRAKKRPLDNPSIVHICDRRQLEAVATHIPETASRVEEKAWPGPLTIVVKKSKSLPSVPTGGLDSVAVRMPAHPVALKLIELSGTPIAAPSANLSGRPSPTNPQHVTDDLGDAIDMVLDAGDTFFGVESTIVDLRGKTPVLLRPGPFTVSELQRLLGAKVRISKAAKGWAEAEVAMAPGMKYRHYAPNTKLVLVDTGTDISTVRHSTMFVAERYKGAGERVLVLSTDEIASAYAREGYDVLSLGARGNLYTVARNLYARLRQVDALGATVVVSESFEDRGIGLAIMNRLRKAASVSIRSL